MKQTTQLAAQICMLLAISYFIEPFIPLISGEIELFKIDLTFAIFNGIPLWFCGIGLQRSIKAVWWIMAFVSAGGIFIGLVNAIGIEAEMYGALYFLSFVCMEPFYGLKTAMITFYPVPEVLTGISVSLVYGLILAMLLLDIPNSRQSGITEQTRAESVETDTGIVVIDSGPLSALASVVRIILAVITTFVIIIGFFIIHYNGTIQFPINEFIEGVIRCITLTIVLTVMLIIRIISRYRAASDKTMR
ncbi:MAG: hypothetical protein ACYC0V_14340 [Armatimonadota bacterium]